VQILSSVPAEVSRDSGATCFHCGLPAPDHKRYRLRVGEEERGFCCPGCLAVADTILGMGMESYYRERESCAPGTLPSASLVPSALEELRSWDNPELSASYIDSLDDGLCSATLMVKGITCAACAWLIETRLAKEPGVKLFRLNLSTHRARVEWDPSRTSLAAVLGAVASVGYPAEPWQADREDDARRHENRAMLMRIGLSGLGAMQVMMFAVGLYFGEHSGIDAAHEYFLRWVSAFVTLPVLLFAGYPFIAGAWRSLRQRTVGMDVPVAIALLMAYVSSIYSTVTDGPEVYFDSVCMFIFFLLLGRHLEMRARHHAATSALGSIGQRTLSARRIEADGRVTRVPADRLSAGERIQVREGDVVPCDGEVLQGVSAVDESMLTGEPLPVAKSAGSHVSGGTLNIDHPLEVRVTKAASASTMNVLRRLLDQAQAEKPRLALIADRIAAKVVARVLLLTVFTWLAWQWVDPSRAFWVALSVLVITCPCALGLAMPTALTSATSALADRGFLVTRGHVLESLQNVRHVVFDKTGTLTEGRLAVTEIQPLADISADRCASLARALESASSHPVARAFLPFPLPDSPAEALRVVPNQGIEGIVAVDGTPTRLRVGTPGFACDLCQRPRPCVHCMQPDCRYTY
jgi:Cu2+-exporting ATPase